MSIASKDDDGNERSSLSFGDIVARRADANKPSDPFRWLWGFGYRRLVPIIPPDAEISERSHYAKRLAAGKDARGKMPGIRGYDGRWTGLAGWQTRDTTDSDIAVWSEMGAGVGIVDDGGLVIVDIDARDQATADAIESDAIAMLGPSPRRIGSWPKRALIYQSDEPAVFQFVAFEGSQGADRVEILAGQKQLVAAGIHPKTRRPYLWDRPLVARTELTKVTPDQVAAFLETTRLKLPKATKHSAGATSDRSAFNQDGLKASNLDRLRKAVEALPNSQALFPSYDDMIRIGEAIHAATVDAPDIGAELFDEWYGRWEGGDYDPELADAYWATFRAPHSIGADFLLDMAVRHSGGCFTEGDRFFEAGNDNAPIAATQSDEPPLFPDTEPDAPTTYDVFSIEELFARPDPRFMLERHIPEASLGFLYGDPSTGKSFIALDWALHIAFAKATWHGDEIRLPEEAGVIYIVAEGASGFKTRVRAWMKAHNIPDDTANRFGLIFQTVNFMRKDEVDRLAATLRRRRMGATCLLVVDTVSRAMPGADENLQKEMTLFVAACQSLQREFGATVLGVHHANKQGDMRGSGVLQGAGDFVFKLERKSGAQIGTLRCEKQKDAPDGWSETYRLEHIAVDETQSSLVPFRCQAVISSDLTPDVGKAVLSAMSTAWENGTPWSANYRSKRYAGKHMCRDFGFEIDAAKSLLAHLLGMGVIVEAEFSAKDHSKGLKVVHAEAEMTDNLSEEDGANVFR